MERGEKGSKKKRKWFNFLWGIETVFWTFRRAVWLKSFVRWSYWMSLIESAWSLFGRSCFSVGNVWNFKGSLGKLKDFSGMLRKGNFGVFLWLWRKVDVNRVRRLGFPQFGIASYVWCKHFFICFLPYLQLQPEISGSYHWLRFFSCTARQIIFIKLSAEIAQLGER
jgi:hypothetical protein